MSNVIAQFEALRRAHAELLGKHEASLASNQHLEESKRHLEVENAALRARCQELLRRMFGRRSEKLDDLQQNLFDEASTELDAEARERELLADEDTEQEKKTPKRGKRRSRADLPRERVVHDVAQADRICGGCRQTMDKIGEETSEELDYVPAVLRVIEHVRPKYACQGCHDGVVIAEAPERPIPRVLAGAGLLAHIATSKFGHHLPLYRLEQMFAVQGGEISRKQMCGWLGAVAQLLTPIVDQMKQELLAEPLIQSDDTRLRYQDHRASGKMSIGYLWAYSKPWAEVVFDFRTDRSRAGPLEFLGDYHGAVQADGYAGYNELFRKNGVEHVACMAHIRRKIYEARDEHPDLAKLLLAGIQRLYRIERGARDQGVVGAKLVELRGGEPARILGVLETVLTEAKQLVLPKSGFGRAVSYAIDQWPSITRYTKIAQAQLDNNGVESAIRPVALGRKNWLFAGSESGGQRAAILFSLVTTAKRLGIDPYQYLADVIDRIGAHKISRINELTPRAWKAART